MSHRSLSILLAVYLTVGLCPDLVARPHIIIVTNDGGDPEKLYRQFLQDVYIGWVEIDIEPDRYDEDLSDKKKAELQAADLIIVSRDTEGTQYNGDAEFWNALNVPILNHNAKLARSDDHRFWDWLDGDVVECSECTHLTVIDETDPVFGGVEVSESAVHVYENAQRFDLSDQGSAGCGAVLAVVDGNVAIARWLGSEPNYYDGSDFHPGGPRLFFAMPDKTSEFFNNATDDALRMLENALFSLLPPALPEGDIDEDGDVDVKDFIILADCWTGPGDPDPNQCSTGMLEAVARTWLEGIDINAPVPDPMAFSIEPQTLAVDSITMTAATALDSQYGTRYFFECTSGNGPDSEWQRRRVFEPNGLAPGGLYSYRVKARDTSGNANETEFSTPASGRTFGLFTHIADASAAVAIDETRVIVAGDEANYLRVYEWDKPGSGPVLNVPLADHLHIEPSHGETDIEGATWFGGRIFWITSHGRNRDGKYWYSRYQFFATTVSVDGDQIGVTVDGNYTNLIDGLIAYDAIHQLGLAQAIGVSGGAIDPTTIPALAPKEDGLNIEGLATSADGSTMLIGFRNPRPEIADNKYGLLIPLANPEQVVLAGAAPIFEPPILLDLDGSGVRSIEYSPGLGAYLLIAGSHKSGADSPLQILYAYDAIGGSLNVLRRFPNITPEGMFQFPLSPDVQLLSDDGVLLFDTPEGPTENKYLPTEQRTFRTHTISP